MIEKPTVFVIGAGAGVPFGFPTGEALTRGMAANKICVPQKTTTERHPSWGEDVRGRTHLLAEAVKRAQPKSIDDFLRQRVEFADIGKLLIAAHLSKFENPDRLFAYDKPQHWLRYLWHKIQAPPDQFLLRNKASFIVFNYDRCVEHFLTTTMASLFDVTQEQAWNAIKGFIVHPHGILGNYIPADVDGGCASECRDRARKFNPAETVDEAEVAAECIRFFWEEGPEALERRESIDRLLQDAQFVVFLGFGFIESNLELFRVLFGRVESPTDVPVIIGCGFGMGDQERYGVQLRFNNKFQLSALETESFFKEVVPWHELAPR